MIHGTLELPLAHLTCGETRYVAVEHAWSSWKLEVRWSGNAGVYCLDLKLNRLRKSQRGAVLLWQCVDVEAAKRVWYQMMFPKRNIPNPLDFDDEKGPSITKALPNANAITFRKTKER